LGVSILDLMDCRVKTLIYRDLGLGTFNVSILDLMDCRVKTNKKACYISGVRGFNP